MMKVKKDGNTLKYEYRGVTYYFCSDNCQELFGKEPEKFLT